MKNVAIEKKDDVSAEFKLSFSKINFILLGVSIILTIIGFVLLAQPPVDGPVSMTAAPVILIFTYCVLVPFTILYRPKNSKGD